MFDQDLGRRRVAYVDGQIDVDLFEPVLARVDDRLQLLPLAGRRLQLGGDRVPAGIQSGQLCLQFCTGMRYIVSS